MASRVGTWRKLAIWCRSPECIHNLRLRIVQCMHQGEVDIVEGVNDQAPNLSGLHTSPGVHRRHYCLLVSAELFRLLGCTMPASRDETG